MCVTVELTEVMLPLPHFAVKATITFHSKYVDQDFMMKLFVFFLVHIPQHRNSTPCGMWRMRTVWKKMYPIQSAVTLIITDKRRIPRQGCVWSVDEHSSTPLSEAVHLGPVASWQTAPDRQKAGWEVAQSHRKQHEYISIYKCLNIEFPSWQEIFFYRTKHYCKVQHFMGFCKIYCKITESAWQSFSFNSNTYCN